MQPTASLPADRFDDLLRRLPSDLDLDALAHRTKAIERRREIDTGANLLRMALARGPGGLSLSQTAAWASMLGLAEMSDPGVKYRFDKAVEFLDAVMLRQLADKAPGADVRWAGRTLRLSDGSCVKEPGAKTASWRLHGIYDLGRGGLSHLELTDLHGGRSNAARRWRAKSASATVASRARRACIASARRVRTKPISSFGWGGPPSA